MKQYILKNKKPVLCDDILERSKFMSDFKNRRVAETKKGGITVSTVFLGLDHEWGSVTPILFETMIFGGQHNQDQWRYSTWKEAEEGHKKACKLVDLYLIYIVQKILNPVTTL